MVQLIYLARLRDALGIGSEHVALPAAVVDVASLLTWLRGRGDAWAQEFGPGRAVRVAINHDVAAISAPVRAGDEIALFPPVTGG